MVFLFYTYFIHLVFTTALAARLVVNVKQFLHFTNTKRSVTVMPVRASMRARWTVGVKQRFTLESLLVAVWGRFVV